MLRSSITTEWTRNPVDIITGDERLCSETKITRIDDWREIAGLGPINFGSVSFGPTRYFREPNYEATIQRRFDRCCHR